MASLIAAIYIYMEGKLLSFIKDISKPFGIKYI